MTAYAFLSPGTRMMLAGIFFLAALGELALCLYRFICTREWKRCLLPAAVYLFSLVFLAVAIGMRTPAEAPAHPIRLPWIVFPLLSLLIAFYSVVALYRESGRVKNRITPNSVREAMDYLDAGICFADENGRLILVNYVMNHLAFTLLGRYPQTLNEIKAALENPEANGVVRLGENPVLYRFPNGKIWRFVSVPLKEENLSGFIQMTARDMTELYGVNETLRRENEEIRESIQKMKHMIGQMSDLAKEQETLNLKMRIHNDIGASLISLSELAKGESVKDTETQIATLKNALSYFSSVASRENRDDLIAFAAKCGVKLQFDGELPEEEPKKNLIAAALHECVTNCAKHAGGSTVLIRIGDDGGTVTITNDGKPPERPITEGGGLSSLRKKVENAGGEMRITHTPQFTLTLKLREGRKPI